MDSKPDESMMQIYFKTLKKKQTNKLQTHPTKNPLPFQNSFSLETVSFFESSCL